MVPEFEQAVARYCGAHYAIAVTNATSALHLACRALGIGSGDTVWTSPNTFVASANCALYCGADIDFVDIDAKTYNMSVISLQEKLEQASLNGKLPRLLIPVHFAGQSCEMKQISLLAKKYNIFIIEDAAHAIGAQYRGKNIGAAQYSDIVVFSFHPVKLMTTGEGGMLLTNNQKLAQKISMLRSHGVTRDESHMTETSHGDWYYQQLELGYNYRMTDIQAALGLSQLKRLDDFIQKRRKLASEYNKQLAKLPLQLPWQHADSDSSWHLYTIRLDMSQVKKSRKAIFSDLRTLGIGVNVHYIPVHTQPYYQKLGFVGGDFPESERYYQESITLPLFSEMTKHDVVRVKNALSEVI